jgi:hypothetical protein
MGAARRQWRSELHRRPSGRAASPPRCAAPVSAALLIDYANILIGELEPLAAP